MPTLDTIPALTPRRRIVRLLVHLRNAWLILGLVIALIVGLEVILRLGFAAKDALFAPPYPDPRLVADGYGGAEWVQRLFDEDAAKQTEWHPYIYFREKPFEGETINVDARGLRRTWNPPPSYLPGQGPRRHSVWFFGGSAAWGVGARDDFTIPSLVAQRLDQRGIPARVTNFAEIGHVSTQGMIALLLELRRGGRPDAVVFYDGVNDILSAYQTDRAGWPQNEQNRALEFDTRDRPTLQVGLAIRKVVTDSALFRLAGAFRRRLGLPGETLQGLARRPETEFDFDELADSVVATYASNASIIRALGNEYGFRPLFYWQPVLFTKKVPTDFERGEDAKYGFLRALFDPVYDRVRAGNLKEVEGFTDLSRLLDDSERLHYLDFCHVTEDANAILAERIADDLARLLREESEAEPDDTDSAPSDGPISPP